MIIEWSNFAKNDVQRLYEFLNIVNPKAADEAISDIRRYILFLKTQPRLGRILNRYDSREVRSGVVGHYEVRYEINANKIYILRIWHVREHRE